MPIIEFVLLLTLANSAPVLARWLLGDLWDQPLDSALVLRDERRLFGRSKTWRGLIAASLACALACAALGRGWPLGAALGALAMLGDLLASFIKRRLGLDAEARAPRLDSIPEALVPAWVLREPFAFSGLDVLLVVLLFMLTVRLASPLLYRLRLRSRPW
jgi:CDP-2,3-bis-(O-geranylgeranyl)-sn-glycerol synthase